MSTSQRSKRPAKLSTPRSKRQAEYRDEFAALQHGSPELAKQRRIERREWKRLHSKAGRRIDAAVVEHDRNDDDDDDGNDSGHSENQ